MGLGEETKLTIAEGRTSGLSITKYASDSAVNDRLDDDPLTPVLGTLMVHSSYATSDGSERWIQKLLDDFRSMKQTHEEADVLAH